MPHDGAISRPRNCAKCLKCLYCQKLIFNPERLEGLSANGEGTNLCLKCRHLMLVTMCSGLGDIIGLWM
jgi:hypothetical protein